MTDTKVAKNYMQLIGGIDQEYRKFAAKYILEWYEFAKEYEKDNDPKEKYTSWKFHEVREKKFYPKLDQSIVKKLDRLYENENIRPLEYIMSQIDEAMLERIGRHFMANEFKALPVYIPDDQTPSLPPPDWIPIYNSDYIDKEKVLIVNHLFLSWYEWSGETYYKIHLNDGRLISKLKKVRNGDLRRFKDKTKRHSRAVLATQRMDSLVDWSMTEKLSYGQQRSLLRSLKTIEMEYI